MKKKIISIFNLFFIFSIVTAQNYNDLSHLDLNYQIPVKTEDEIITFQKIDFDGNLGIPLFSNNLGVGVLNLGGNILGVQLKSEDTTEYGLFYKTYAGYTFIRKSSSFQRIRTTLFIKPTISSDFKDINKYDLFGEAGFQFGLRIHRNLLYSFGIKYSMQAFGGYLMPTLGFRWNPNRFFQTYAELPESFGVEFMVLKRFNLGFQYKSYLTTYRRSAENEHAFLQIASDNATAFIDYFWKQNWIIRFQAGYARENTFLYYNYSDNYVLNIAKFYFRGEMPEPTSTDVRDGIVVCLALKYRLYYDN